MIGHILPTHMDRGRRLLAPGSTILRRTRRLTVPCLRGYNAFVLHKGREAEMAAMSTTSMRLPDDLRERYDAFARLTGQTRNDLIIAAMGEYIEREMREIALIQEGFDAIDRGEYSPLEDVVQRLAARGMLDRAALERDRARASADQERATA